MKKYIPGSVLIVIGLFFTYTALGSEGCLPFQEVGGCFSYPSPENIFGLVVSIIVTIIGAIKVWRIRRIKP